MRSRKNLVRVLAAVGPALLPAVAGGEPAADTSRTLRAVESALASGQRSATDVLLDPALLSLHTDTRFRDLVRSHPALGQTALAGPEEPGRPLVVSGTVRVANGRPVVGALVYVFHADAKGFYTPEKAMDEPHARLFAYLHTDAAGRFEFRTVRPGPYPRPMRIRGEERRIPSHIHCSVTAAGWRELRIQIYFADDPLMQAAWARDNAAEHRWPVLEVATGVDGVARSVCDLRLEAGP